jgi:hypothetical protein
MYHIDIMCDRAMWIENGRIKMLDKTSDVIRRYEAAVLKREKTYRKSHDGETLPAAASSPCIISDVSIRRPDGSRLTELAPFEDVILQMKVEALDDELRTHFGFALVRSDELICFGSLTTYDGCELTVLGRGEHVRVTLRLDQLSLLDGEYRVVGGITDEHGLHLHHVKYSEPFMIKSDHEGLGVVSFRREWAVVEDDSAIEGG